MSRRRSWLNRHVLKHWSRSTLVRRGRGGRRAAAICVTAKCCCCNLFADDVFSVSCDIQPAAPVNNPVSCHHGHRSVFVFGVVVGWGWGGWRVSFLVYSSVLMSLHDNRATVQHLVVLSRRAGLKLLAWQKDDSTSRQTDNSKNFSFFFLFKKRRRVRKSVIAQGRPPTS